MNKPLNSKISCILIFYITFYLIGTINSTYLHRYLRQLETDSETCASKLKFVCKLNEPTYEDSFICLISHFNDLKDDCDPNIIAAVLATIFIPCKNDFNTLCKDQKSDPYTAFGCLDTNYDKLSEKCSQVNDELETISLVPCASEVKEFCEDNSILNSALDCITKQPDSKLSWSCQSLKQGYRHCVNPDVDDNVDIEPSEPSKSLTTDDSGEDDHEVAVTDDEKKVTDEPIAPKDSPDDSEDDDEIPVKVIDTDDKPTDNITDNTPDSTDNTDKEDNSISAKPTDAPESDSTDESNDTDTADTTDTPDTTQTKETADDDKTTANENTNEDDDKSSSSSTTTETVKLITQKNHINRKIAAIDGIPCWAQDYSVDDDYTDNDDTNASNESENPKVKVNNTASTFLVSK